MQYAGHAFKHPAQQHYSLSSLLLLLQQVGSQLTWEFQQVIMPNHLALNTLWTEAVSVLLFDIPHSALF
jgi:hypothetical protein